MGLQPLLETPSLNERAYSAIKEAILSLELQPGEVLAIGNLAKRLGVSRTPVRDALLLLEKDGLVTLLPQRGAKVTEICEQDIAEIFELRIVLEGYAVRKGVERLAPEDLEQLEAIIEKAEQAFEDGQRVQAADLGRQLHDLFIGRACNERLQGVLDQLESHYTRIRRFAALIPGRFAQSHREHTAILAAVQRGDPEAAERAMMAHLSSVRDDVLANAELWTHCLENAEEVPELPALLLNPRLD
jgi:DNA-binding GntR family transcriptional regulator